MGAITLYEDGPHKNVQLEDFGHGEMVQANQHVIVHGKAGIILDPGGHKVYSRALTETLALVKPGELRYVFCSHQDPDIVAALNGWLMTTNAEALAPSLWLRFIPHFGVDQMVVERLKPIPDEGMILDLDGCKLTILPAHFLHSCGNYQVYDPTSKILYSGDLGASLGAPYAEVSDFNAHLQHMQGFHQRYMTSRSVMAAWADMIRSLDVEVIAPQHGAYFKGKEMVKAFVDWCAGLECGVDLIKQFKVPAT